MARLVLALFCVIAVVAVPERADACGNSMRQHRTVGSDRELLAARQALEHGDWAEAIARAEPLIKSLDPQASHHMWARRVAGIAHLRLGRAEKARGHLQRARGYFTDDNVVTARLAEAELAMGGTKAARDLLEPLVADDMMPDADGWTALAKARKATGDAEGARKAVDAALAMDGKHAEALALQKLLSPSAPPPDVPAEAPVKQPSI